MLKQTDDSSLSFWRIALLASPVITAVLIAVVMVINGSNAVDAQTTPAGKAQISPEAQPTDYFPNQYPSPTGAIQEMPPTF